MESITPCYTKHWKRRATGPPRRQDKSTRTQEMRAAQRRCNKTYIFVAFATLPEKLKISTKATVSPTCTNSKHAPALRKYAHSHRKGPDDASAKAKLHINLKPLSACPTRERAYFAYTCALLWPLENTFGSYMSRPPRRAKLKPLQFTEVLPESRVPGTAPTHKYTPPNHTADAPEAKNLHFRSGFQTPKNYTTEHPIKNVNRTIAITKPLRSSRELKIPMCIRPKIVVFG